MDDVDGTRIEVNWSQWSREWPSRPARCRPRLKHVVVAVLLVAAILVGVWP